MNTYERATAWLFGKNRAVGLRSSHDRMAEAAAAVGSPESHLRCVHVAGTNGKGSICTKVAKAFELAGYRVGLYTSPHISSFRERIQVNGALIPCDAVVRLASQIREKCPEDLSFFEAATLMAFLWYGEQGVDLAVLETGLGGRLDATNLCHPDLSIISSISLDHTQYLGTTVEQIAREKAGIIKEGVPVIIGPRVPLGPVQEVAHDKKAALIRVQGEFLDYDEENGAIAREAMEWLSAEWNVRDWADDALCVRPCCRFQEIDERIIEELYGVSVRVVLDVAHNPDGITHLLMKAKRRFERDDFVFLLGVSQDKDILRMVTTLREAARAIVCTEASCPRALGSSELAQIVGKPHAIAEPQMERAVATAIHKAAREGVPLLITGTFFLMHSVRRLLGFLDFYDDAVCHEVVCQK